MTRHQATFEAFYAKHDKDRKGPSPEAIGLREAQEILDLEHLANLPTVNGE